MAKEAKSGVPAAFAKRLKDANKSWKSAKKAAAEAATGVPEFEDGRYVARLTGGKIAESGSGRLQVVFVFKFEEDPYEGQEKFDYQGIESEQNLEFLARRLSQLGYELPEDLTTITDILNDIAQTKPLCKIRLRTKGEFQNVYIDKVFDPGDELDEDEDESGGDVPAEEPEAPKGKKSKKKEPKPPADEEDDDEEDNDDAEEESDEVELTVGMAVVAETSKGERTGEVLEILEAEGKARVKMADDGKVLRIALDKISVAATDDEEEDDEEEDDVPEEPVKPAKGKKTK